MEDRAKPRYARHAEAGQRPPPIMKSRQRPSRQFQQFFVRKTNHDADFFSFRAVRCLQVDLGNGVRAAGEFINRAFAAPPQFLRQNDSAALAIKE